MNHQEEPKGHIVAMMLKAREDAQIEYGPAYRKVIFPYRDYILQQMQVKRVDNHIEMAVEMIQDAEQNYEEDVATVLIMQILAGAMEIEDAS